jgi:pimeloyl-ACP methyl ester carboxylesterase
MKLTHRARFVSRPLGVYFDQLAPAVATLRVAVVMVHGGSHTGSCFLLTAEGRRGWAYQFAERGYTVLVPDWPGHGRSGALDLDTLSGDDVCLALTGLIESVDEPVILLTHSMGSAFGWRIAELCRERIVAIVALAPAPPGNIQAEPEIVSDTNASLVLRTPFRTVVLSKRDRAVLADPEFVLEKLLGNSTQFPFDMVDAYSKLLTHTGKQLLYQRLNVRGSQVCLQDPKSLLRMPVLIVTGDQDLEHPKQTDQGLAEWLSGYGADVKFLWLPDHGIVGNGHMMMERNSEQIADLVLDWLSKLDSVMNSAVRE